MKNLTIHLTWFRVILIIVLILGISFRLINLDQKVYWHDEVYTSLRIAGYSGEDVGEQLFTGEIITREDVLQFQRPTAERDWQDVFRVLSQHPEHPPLYYIIARFWVLLFGASVTSIRALSAWLSLLIFPSIYWLCWQLFRSSKVGWMAILLVSISPFYVLYAQEAREYCLWAVLILLSSAALLQAINQQKKGSRLIYSVLAWSLYTLTLTLNLYTSLITGFVAIGYGIYMILIERFRWTRCFSSFLISSFIAALLYIPWVLVLVNNFAIMQSKTAWMKGSKPVIELLSRWELNFSSIFIDIHPSINYFIIARISIFFFFGIGYSIYCLYRHSSKKAGLFIITLIAIPALALILPDLIRGGQRSINARYFIPSYIGMQLSVAYLLCNLQWVKVKIRSILLPLIISCGVISCLISAQADTWWTKSASYTNAEAAMIINQSNRPLVISDTNHINVGNIISLTHKLDSKVRLQLVIKPNIPQIPKIPTEFSDIFLYNPSTELVSGIEDEYNLTVNSIEETNAPLDRVEQL